MMTIIVSMIDWEIHLVFVRYDGSTVQIVPFFPATTIIFFVGGGGFLSSGSTTSEIQTRDQLVS